jgi:hypothetical protein
MHLLVLILIASLVLAVAAALVVVRRRRNADAEWIRFRDHGAYGRTQQREVREIAPGVVTDGDELLFVPPIAQKESDDESGT